MIRISTIFIAICMVLVAASLGLILYSMAGISGSESAIVALTALTFLILYNAVSMRLRDRTDVGSQIADLSRGTADLARQVAEFGRRLSALEGRMVSSNSVSADRLHGVIGEITELGGLMKQLAVTVAQHEDIIATIPTASTADADAPAATRDANRPLPAAPSLGQAPETKAASSSNPDVKTTETTATFSAPPAPAPVVAPQAPAVAVSPVTAVSAPAPSTPASPPASRSQPQILAAVKGAIEDNRLDIYLQPLVTLPQRKVRFYEAVTRLRDDSDHVLAAEDFIGIAEAAGLVGRIDHMVMLRCVQVLRRLMVRNKDVGIFCNVSAATLSSPSNFSQCLDFLEANRALAPSFVLEFKQATLRALGQTETEHLAALAQRGYRFSIDHVTDLRFEPRELADRGVRFIKVPAALLLDPRQGSVSDIHPTDLSDLLGRFGIDLIAERIEGESSVIDLLDYDVRFGQGFLFAPPRPLRPEGASATGGAISGPGGGQDIKIQDPHAAGNTTSDASTANAATRSGNAALARRIAGTI
ncbi:EAL domain-containing protein [Bradyrhizobium ontarionense]|uniref:EAL domain-containing protein n=1 Tax=Bradyrhizobium ontarionense TaxID=2898149 RepID=A0ABY3R8M7_9BRAD|nr:EAL domain-containing protein [Bradyrhizobium sp. A19]UFZ03544.1 EAL domain-containing protein [Bradyrhizobium sp. A19]